MVGTLWDVTDRDIDRLSLKMLEYWGALPKETDSEPKETTEEGRSLAESLAVSRDTCTLRYLNGASPVVYGLPVYLNN